MAEAGAVYSVKQSSSSDGLQHDRVTVSGIYAKTGFCAPVSDLA